MGNLSPPGVIHADEAYSKAELLRRFGISQKFWDQMISEGLPYTPVGKSRWVSGRDLLDYLRRKSETKESQQTQSEDD